MVMIKPVLANDSSISHKTVKVLSVLIGFSQALIVYIASSYFKEISGFDEIGVFYVAIYVLLLVALLNLHKLIRRIGKTRILIFSLLGQILVLLGLIFFQAAILKIGLMVIFLLLDQLLLVSLDIIVESLSKDDSTGRMRGLHLTILNFGFIVGPKVSTWLLSSFGFLSVFSFVALLKIVVLVLAYLRLGRINHVFIEKESIINLIKKGLARPDIRHIYYISFALESFYALMIMYLPIYLTGIGFSLTQIGTIFTIMLLPFLFFEYPIGWLADKELGEKEMIIISLSWMALATTWVYRLDQPSVWLWALVLLATRFGAAALEILRDSYFYKKIDGNDVDLIDFYRTARPAAYILAASFSVFFIKFYGLREVFLFAALVLLSALYPAWRLKDNLSEREIMLLSKKRI